MNEILRPKGMSLSALNTKIATFNRDLRSWMRAEDYFERYTALQEEISRYWLNQQSNRVPLTERDLHPPHGRPPRWTRSP
jgi:hypothetical protein